MQKEKRLEKNNLMSDSTQGSKVVDFTADETSDNIDLSSKVIDIPYTRKGW